MYDVLVWGMKAGHSFDLHAGPFSDYESAQFIALAIFRESKELTGLRVDGCVIRPKGESALTNQCLVRDGHGVMPKGYGITYADLQLAYGTATVSGESMVSVLDQMGIFGN